MTSRHLQILVVGLLSFVSPPSARAQDSPPLVAAPSIASLVPNSFLRVRTRTGSTLVGSMSRVDSAKVWLSTSTGTVAISWPAIVRIDRRDGHPILESAFIGGIVGAAAGGIIG